MTHKSRANQVCKNKHANHLCSAGFFVFKVTNISFHLNIQVTRFFVNNDEVRIDSDARSSYTQSIEEHV